MFGLKTRKSNRSRQKQGSGDNSTNLQGQSIVVHQGISYSDAREIAKDVFKSNFLELKQEAATIAQQRAEEVTEKVISQLSEKHPGLASEFEKPAMQNALFTVQKEYAISGDKDVGDLLVDILVDRAAQSKRNMMQVVLDEALSIASKLTVDQLDTLSLNFLLLRTRRLDILNYDGFVEYFKKRVVPFVDNLVSSSENYNYIEYLGCGYVRAGSYGELDVKIRDAYKVFFSSGFTEQELKEKIGEGHNIVGLIIKCFHDPEKLQLRVRDDEDLIKVAKKNGLDDETIGKLTQLFEATTKTPAQVREIVVRDISEMQIVFDVWGKSPFKHLELTGVGIAIAHANYRRKIGETMDLSIWLGPK